MLNCSLSERMGVSSVGMLGREQSQGQLGLSYQTRLGVLKAELLTNGIVQTTLEGLQPLPFMQITTQAAFVKQGLAMGGLQTVCMTPVGFLMGSVNLMGQMSCEFVSGAPAGDGQVMFGAHVWGFPGIYGGTKAALEWTRPVLDEQGEFTGRLSAITLACTRPRKEFEGVSTVSLTAANRMSETNSVLASIERNAQGNIEMAVGGSGLVRPGMRMRGRFTTKGVLGMALELPTEKSNLTLSMEIGSDGREPKFGATVQLSP